jgi:hypothetical protein
MAGGAEALAMVLKIILICSVGRPAHSRSSRHAPRPDLEAKAQGIPVVTVTETLTPAGASFQEWQVRQLRELKSALAEATGRR